MTTSAELLMARVGRSATPTTASASIGSFATVYDDHYADVYRHVIFSTRGRDDVDDIVSDTFERAFAAWRSGHGPAGQPLPWLLLIARRIVTDRWRRRRLIQWLPLAGRRDRERTGHGRPREPFDVPTPGDAPDTVDFWMWLDALSRALPSKQRDVLFLRYQRDLTDDEIGEVLGLSASGVRTLVSRALAALRRHPELWS